MLRCHMVVKVCKRVQSMERLIGTSLNVKAAKSFEPHRMECSCLHFPPLMYEIFFAVEGSANFKVMTFPDPPTEVNLEEASSR